LSDAGEEDARRLRSIAGRGDSSSDDEGPSRRLPFFREDLGRLSWTDTFFLALFFPIPRPEDSTEVGEAAGKGSATARRDGFRRDFGGGRDGAIVVATVYFKMHTGWLI